MKSILNSTFKIRKECLLQQNSRNQYSCCSHLQGINKIASLMNCILLFIFYYLHVCIQSNQMDDQHNIYSQLFYWIPQSCTLLETCTSQSYQTGWNVYISSIHVLKALEQYPTFGYWKHATNIKSTSNNTFFYRWASQECISYKITLHWLQWRAYAFRNQRYENVGDFCNSRGIKLPLF